MPLGNDRVILKECTELGLNLEFIQKHEYEKSRILFDGKEAIDLLCSITTWSRKPGEYFVRTVRSLRNFRSLFC